MVRRAAASLPGEVTVDVISSDAIRRVEGADCLVVSLADDARTARATGFDGAIIVFGSPRSSDEVASFRSQGTHFAAIGDGDALSSALAHAIATNNDASTAVDASVARMRRLIAAGELAVALRHSLNNPLAALMAEVQLLQLEAVDDDTRAAAGRMLELVRRLTEVSRSLESVRDR